MKSISIIAVIAIIVGELVAIWLLDLPEGLPRAAAFGAVVLTGLALYFITHARPRT